MSKTVKYDEAKLTELVLYIGGKCALHEHYGVVKLNKILFYSDFAAYRSLGFSITGARYRKYPFGPAPAVMGLLHPKLIKKNVVFEYKHSTSGFDANGAPMAEKRLLPKRDAKLDRFSGAEIAIVDTFIERFRTLTGADLIDQSHQHPGWKLSEMEGEIPYFTAYLSDMPPAPLSARDLTRAKAVARKYAKGKYTQDEAIRGDAATQQVEVLREMLAASHEVHLEVRGHADVCQCMECVFWRRPDIAAAVKGQG